MTDELRFLLNYGLRTTFDPVIDESDRDKNAVIVQVCKPRDRKSPFTWSRKFVLSDERDGLSLRDRMAEFFREVKAEFMRDWL